MNEGIKETIKTIFAMSPMGPGDSTISGAYEGIMCLIRKSGGTIRLRLSSNELDLSSLKGMKLKLVNTDSKEETLEEIDGTGTAIFSSIDRRARYHIVLIE